MKENDAFYRWHEKNAKETDDPYPPTRWELVAFQAGQASGMEMAAEIAEDTKVGHRGGDAVYGKLLAIQAIRKEIQQDDE